MFMIGEISHKNNTPKSNEVAVHQFLIDFRIWHAPIVTRNWFNRSSLSDTPYGPKTGLTASNSLDRLQLGKFQVKPIAPWNFLYGLVKSNAAKNIASFGLKLAGEL